MSDNNVQAGDFFIAVEDVAGREVALKVCPPETACCDEFISVEDVVGREVQAPATGDINAGDFFIGVQDVSGDEVAIALCAGSASNPCEPDAEMLLTVTGTTGTINWCGETWNLPADSGVEKSVCPTVYALYKYTNTTTGTTFNSRVISCMHVWEYNYNSLRLQREYARRDDLLANKMFMAFGKPIKTWIALNKAPTASSQDFISFTATGFGTPLPPPMNLSGASSFPLGVLTTGASPPRSNDFEIHDGMFGNTTIAGVNYAWAKGQGWP